VNVVARVRQQSVEDLIMPFFPTVSDQAATGLEPIRRWNDSRE